MMHNLSAMQLLTLWSALEDARAGAHGYGGSVAEVYLYTAMAMPYSPLVASADMGTSALAREAAKEAYRTARASMLHVFQTFAEMRGCRVAIEQGRDDFVEAGPWFVDAEYEHRIHVHVTEIEPHA